MKLQIGIIGFGNFGKFMAKHLKNKAELVVTDNADKSKEAAELGVKFSTLDEILKRKIIILAVPMENFVETLHKIKNKLQEGSLIVDVCSLKMFSCKAMKKILPENVEIIGSHPLFGPQSVKQRIKGMKIVLCKVKAKDKTFQKVKKFCEELELKVITSTTEEHDKQMAVSQALTHFVGQALKNINIKRLEMSTKTFDDLMNIVNIIKNDTTALFENMQTMNPFAEEIRKKFIKEAEKMNAQLNSKRKRETK
jgi:prephenate dehydrogenase